MNISAQLEILVTLLIEVVVRDGLAERLRDLSELLVALILKDEICLFSDWLPCSGWVHRTHCQISAGSNGAPASEAQFSLIMQN